jgi:hypothetical protein
MVYTYGLKGTFKMPHKATGNIGKDGRIPLTVRLKPDTWKALDEKAKGGIPKNVWVQEMLDQFLNKIEFHLDRIDVLPSLRSATPRRAGQPKQPTKK